MACSSESPETPVSTSNEALAICNCPLEMPDGAVCTCPGPDAGHAHVRECNHADDCRGPLPALCEVCPNGGDGCAHFECVKHHCEVAFCPAK